MTTLAEHIIAAGAENRPLMLEKSMYDSWASRIRLFIKGKKHGRVTLDSIDNGPLVYPTIEEDGQTRLKKYSELTAAQKLQDDCDVQASNIILHSLPPDVYVLVNHQETAKDTWDTVKLLMKGTELSYQERECRFKFVTDVKLAKSLYTTNYDKLYAYLSQHERHANEVCLMHERYPDPLALEAGQILDEEQLAFLADPRIDEAPVASQTIPRNSAFQTEDLDAYDSNCDDISLAKAVPMANLSRCDLDVLSEVPYSDTYLNDMINQDVQEMPYSEQTYIMDSSDNEITSDSNINLYSQYLQESQNAGIQDTNSSAPNDLLVLSLVEQMTDHVANLDKENQTNKMVNEFLTDELERYKERVTIFERRLNVDLNKREKLIDSQMDDLIRNRNAKFAAFQQEIDTLKETLSNQVKEKEPLSTTLTVFKRECKEKESKCMDKEIVLENQNKELENTLCAWGFEHTKACFVTKIISILKVLKDTFNAFDKIVLDEITEVQTVFNQIEAAVDQCSVDKNAFEIQIKQLRIDNDQLLKQIMSQEIVHTIVNSVDSFNKSCVDECNKCLKLKTELLKKKDLIEKYVYDKLLKSYSTLENHCISLELTTQLNQEILQKDNFHEN
ncbi:hypothetical protein Tco_0201348 [Tanacetum coccineum]